MKRVTFIALAVLGVALSTRSASSSVQPAPLYNFHHENVLGTSLELKLGAASQVDAERAEAAALAEIDRNAKILSAWDPQSEFSCWAITSGQPVAISRELVEVLGLFDRWRSVTGGALNPAAEVVIRAWKNAESQHRLPSDTELTAAVSAAQVNHWTLDSQSGTATRTSNTPLVLASFAKSWIAGKAADAAIEAGANAAVVNIGGDLVVRGDHTEAVDIADPRDRYENGKPVARLLVQDRAVATSGNYRRGFDIAGVHYSHIVDPRTGQPTTDILSATVVAADPAEAGALATAFTVLGVEESRKIAETRPHVDYMMIRKDGTQIASRGWSALAAPAYFAAAAVTEAPYELGIQLELARADSPRFRRPYVAIWVEDKDRFPVRTVALWFDKQRWLPELKAWSHADRMRSLAEGSDITTSVASATRAPGKYSLKWDGKDNQGKPVKPGKYTVYIEASREHGTYELLKQEIDYGSGAAKQFQLQTSTEIAAASLDYHKTSR